jgi:hypothetical protein
MKGNGSVSQQLVVALNVYGRVVMRERPKEA